MKRTARRLCSGALLFALAVPAAAQADDQGLQLKVEELTRKVNKLEEKTLSKWLTIGGDYRFRFDSLRGSTVAYTDAFGSLSNASRIVAMSFCEPRS